MKHAALLLLTASCATTHIGYEGEVDSSDPIRAPTIRRTTPLDGVLRDASIECNSSVTVERSFESSGFAPSRPIFLRRPGDRCVLQATDGESTQLFVSMEHDRPGTQTEIVPFFSAVRETNDVTSALVCKGGTGRVTVADGGGTLSVRVVCRSYVNGHELHERFVDIAGSF